MSEELETQVEATRLSIFDICETDTTAEEEGRWFQDIFEDGSDVHVKLRRLTSKKSVNARRRLDKQYRGKMRKNGEYPEDVAVEVMIKQVAEAVIVDWANIIDQDGYDIPYSYDNAIMLMKRLPAFRDLIVVYANNLDNFRIEEREEAEKN